MTRRRRQRPALPPGYALVAAQTRQRAAWILAGLPRDPELVTADRCAALDRQIRRPAVPRPAVQAPPMAEDATTRASVRRLLTDNPKDSR